MWNIKTTKLKNNFFYKKSIYWYQATSVISWVVLSGFIWFQIAPGGLRLFLVLVSTERFNVGLIWCAYFSAKIYFVLAFAQSYNYFDS